MNLPKKMWAGVVDGQIYTTMSVDTTADSYTPVGVALFTTEEDARRHFEHVIEINGEKLMTVKEK